MRVDRPTVTFYVVSTRDVLAETFKSGSIVIAIEKKTLDMLTDGETVRAA